MFWENVERFDGAIRLLITPTKLLIKHSKPISGSLFRNVQSRSLFHQPLLMFAGHLPPTFPKVQLRLREGSDGTPQPQTADRPHQQGGPRNARQARTEALRAWCRQRKEGNTIVPDRHSSLTQFPASVDTATASGEGAGSRRTDHHRLRGRVRAGPFRCHTGGDHRLGRYEGACGSYLEQITSLLFLLVRGRMDYRLVNSV